MARTLNPESTYLADQIERSVHGGAWHGMAVDEALASIPVQLTARAPRNSNNTILSIAEHIAFWLETAEARLHGKQRRGAADWSEGEGSAEERWQRARERIVSAAAALGETVRELDAAGLEKPVAGSDPVARGLILGLLQHNAYHTAQILMIQRELEGAGS